MPAKPKSKKTSTPVVAVEQDVVVTNAVVETQELVVTNAVVETQELVVADAGMTEEIVPAAESALAEVIDYSGYGEEHAGAVIKLKASEVLIPTIKIVQESSKIWKNRGDSAIQLGDIYNTQTLEYWSGTSGVLIAPICAKEVVIERKPSPDGSYIATLEVNDKRVQDAIKNNQGDGWKKLHSLQRTQLNYTMEVAVVLLDPADGETPLGVGMVPFAGTNVYPWKIWWNKLAEVPHANKTPKYAFRTLLTTVLREKTTSAGVDSYKFAPKPFKGTWSTCRFPPNHPALTRCLDFEKLYNTGKLGKVDYSDVSDADDSEDAREAGVFGGDQPAF